MRLQKFLARAGVASRRKSEELIVQRRVRVDGVVVSELGSSVDPARQRVEVDGREVTIGPPRWVLLNKPPGVLCTRSDPRGRPTVYGLLPEADEELFHVGRLDFMSEGLLLLTNEGDLAHELLHPSREVRRRYEVALAGPVDPALPARLVEGVRLEDGPARALDARWIGDPGGGVPELTLTLTEGRNREIRRMLGALDVNIRRLRRVAFGPIELGDLPVGEARALTPGEMSELRRLAGVTAARGRDHGTDTSPGGS